MRTGADNYGSWVSLYVGGHSEDRCGQVWTTLVPGFLSMLADIWWTGADRCGKLWLLVGGYGLSTHLGYSYILKRLEKILIDVLFMYLLLVSASF